MLSIDIIESVTKLNDFKTKEKLLKMVVQYGLDLNTVLSKSTSQKDSENEESKSSLIFEIMDSISFISPVQIEAISQAKKERQFDKARA